MPMSAGWHAHRCAPASRLSSGDLPKVRLQTHAQALACRGVHRGSREAIEQRVAIDETVPDRLADEASILLAADHRLGHDEIVHLQAQPRDAARALARDADESLLPPLRQHRRLRADSLGVVPVLPMEGRKLADAAVDEVGPLGVVARVEIRLDRGSKRDRRVWELAENRLAADDDDLLIPRDLRRCAQAYQTTHGSRNGHAGPAPRARWITCPPIAAGRSDRSGGARSAPTWRRSRRDAPRSGRGAALPRPRSARLRRSPRVFQAEDLSQQLAHLGEGERGLLPPHVGASEPLGLGSPIHAVTITDWTRPDPSASVRARHMGTA